MTNIIKIFTVLVGMMAGFSSLAYPNGLVPSNARNPNYNAFLYQEFVSSLQSKFGSANLGQCEASQLANNQRCTFYSGGQECTGVFNSSSSWHYYPDRIIFTCGNQNTIVRRSSLNIAQSRRFLESLGLAYPEKFPSPVHRGRCTYGVSNGMLIAYGWCN